MISSPPPAPDTPTDDLTRTSGLSDSQTGKPRTRRARRELTLVAVAAVAIVTAVVVARLVLPAMSDSAAAVPDVYVHLGGPVDGAEVTALTDDGTVVATAVADDGAVTFDGLSDDDRDRIWAVRTTGGQIDGVPAPAGVFWSLTVAAPDVDSSPLPSGWPLEVTLGSHLTTMLIDTFPDMPADAARTSMSHALGFDDPDAAMSWRTRHAGVVFDPQVFFAAADLLDTGVPAGEADIDTGAGEADGAGAPGMVGMSDLVARTVSAAVQADQPVAPPFVLPASSVPPALQLHDVAGDAPSQRDAQLRRDLTFLADAYEQLTERASPVVDTLDGAAGQSGEDISAESGSDDSGAFDELAALLFDRLAYPAHHDATTDELLAELDAAAADHSRQLVVAATLRSLSERPAQTMSRYAWERLDADVAAIYDVLDAARITTADSGEQVPVTDRPDTGHVGNSELLSFRQQLTFRLASNDGSHLFEDGEIDVLLATLDTGRDGGWRLPSTRELMIAAGPLSGSTDPVSPWVGSWLPNRADESPTRWWARDGEQRVLSRPLEDADDVPVAGVLVVRTLGPDADPAVSLLEQFDTDSHLWVDGGRLVDDRLTDLQRWVAPHERAHAPSRGFELPQADLDGF